MPLTASEVAAAGVGLSRLGRAGHVITAWDLGNSLATCCAITPHVHSTLLRAFKHVNRGLGPSEQVRPCTPPPPRTHWRVGDSLRAAHGSGSSACGCSAAGLLLGPERRVVVARRRLHGSVVLRSVRLHRGVLVLGLHRRVVVPRCRLHGRVVVPSVWLHGSVLVLGKHRRMVVPHGGLEWRVVVSVTDLVSALLDTTHDRRRGDDGSEG